MMDRLKKLALQKCTVELVRDLNPDLIRGSLFSRHMLTRDEMERLGLPVMTTRDKNHLILQVLPTKGRNAFDLFVESLQDTSRENPTHQDLADTLVAKLHELEDSSTARPAGRSS